MLSLKQVRTFARAIWSFLRWGDVSLVEHDRRQVICHGCEQFRVGSNRAFCLACGCPPSPISDLRTKWRMRNLKCPIDKW